MNDTERRRKELLDQTRMRYHDKGMPPAVHPRYRAFYKELYEEDAEVGKGGTFGIRSFICILCFAVFVLADYKETEILNWKPSAIIKEISQPFGMQKKLENFIKFPQ